MQICFYACYNTMLYLNKSFSDKHSVLLQRRTDKKDCKILLLNPLSINNI